MLDAFILENWEINIIQFLNCLTENMQTREKEEFRNKEINKR